MLTDHPEMSQEAVRGRRRAARAGSLSRRVSSPEVGLGKNWVPMSHLLPGNLSPICVSAAVSVKKQRGLTLKSNLVFKHKSDLRRLLSQDKQDRKHTLTKKISY